MLPPYTLPCAEHANRRKLPDLAMSTCSRNAHLSVLLPRFLMGRGGLNTSCEHGLAWLQSAAAAVVHNAEMVGAAAGFCAAKSCVFRTATYCLMHWRLTAADVDCVDALSDSCWLHCSPAATADAVADATAAVARRATGTWAPASSGFASASSTCRRRSRTRSGTRSRWRRSSRPQRRSAARTATRNVDWATGSSSAGGLRQLMALSL